MKIAVASTGKSEDSEVSPISGRAEYYLIFEGGKLVKTISNPFKIGGGGAGPAVVQMLANEGVEKIISGRFGPKMVQAMEDKGIKHETVEGKKVKEVAK
jgi:predicted Fe-Mo cluster-binding NifX family protein